MNFFDRLLGVAERHRRGTLGLAAILTTATAAADWRIEPNVSLGFVYVIPVLLASIHMAPWEIVAMAYGYAALRELFAPFMLQPGYPARIAVGWGVFAASGMLMAEMSRNRRLARQHLESTERLTRQLRAIIETSPMAILTCNPEGRVLLANDSARVLLGIAPGGEPGAIGQYMELLGNSLPSVQPGWKTELECRGRRADGELFFARVWLSGYETACGPQMAIVVWDASEELRQRESAAMDSLAATSRVLLGALSHELRNLTAAAMNVYNKVAHSENSRGDRDFQALGSVLQALSALASSGLRAGAQRRTQAVDLRAVLDEVRIVLAPALEEGGAVLKLELPPDLPLVHADHSSLIQVLLNFAQNSLRAMQGCERRELRVECAARDGHLTVRFRDTGRGVEHPELLFEPFRSPSGSFGLGLYVSRAIVRSFGGNLRYEPQQTGACFALDLRYAGELVPEAAG